jgi:hypothetical protein
VSFWPPCQTRRCGAGAVGALLGHAWLSTTARYVHVPAERIERCWQEANARVVGRLLGPDPYAAAAAGPLWA